MSQSGSNSRVDRAISAVMILAALGGVLGGWWASKKHPSSAVSSSPRHLIDFTLTDRTGRQVSRADLTNQFLVVNFVFTSCSGFCLQVNRQMGRIQRLVAGQNDVRLVSLTVDPRTDNPAVLGKFANQFGADTNRWLWLTGDKAVLCAVIETSFLERSQDPVWSAMPGGFMQADRIATRRSARPSAGLLRRHEEHHAQRRDQHHRLNFAPSFPHNEPTTSFPGAAPISYPLLHGMEERKGVSVATHPSNFLAIRSWPGASIQSPRSSKPWSGVARSSRAEVPAFDYRRWLQPQIAAHPNPNELWRAYL